MSFSLHDVEQWNAEMPDIVQKGTLSHTTYLMHRAYCKGVDDALTGKYMDSPLSPPLNLNDSRN